MARATVIKGGKVVILLGDDNDPVTYANPCGLTSRRVSFTKNLDETPVPDCKDQDKVDWVGRGATSLSMEISGEGVLVAESKNVWNKALISTESVPVKIVIEYPSETDTWEGKMQVNQFEIDAQNGITVKCNVSMASDGEMVLTSTEHGS